MAKAISGVNLEFGLTDVKDYIDRQSLYQAWLDNGGEGSLEDCLTELATVSEGFTDLSDYYKKTETYSQAQVNDLIDGIDTDVDLSGYYLKTETYNKNEVYNNQETYSKAEVNTKVSEIEYDDLENKPTINGQELTSDGITLNLRQYDAGRNVTFDDIDDGKLWINVDLDEEKYVEGDGLIITQVQKQDKPKLEIKVDFCTEEDVIAMMTRVGFIKSQDPPPQVDPEPEPDPEPDPSGWVDQGFSSAIPYPAISGDYVVLEDTGYDPSGKPYILYWQLNLAGTGITKVRVKSTTPQSKIRTIELYKVVSSSDYQLLTTWTKVTGEVLITFPQNDQTYSIRLKSYTANNTPDFVMEELYCTN
jgi:hypothetical protein